MLWLWTMCLRNDAIWQQSSNVFLTFKSCTIRPNLQDINSRDFPGGPVVKNPPSNAVNAGSILGRGTKIPHAMGQLSPHTTTTEPPHLNETACVPQTTEPMHPGVHVPQLEREIPHATTREKPEHGNEEPRHCNKKKSLMPQWRSHVLQLRPNAAKKIN